MDDKNAAARQYDFYEARVLGLVAEHFMSNIRLYHEYDRCSVIRYTFVACYNVRFTHADEQIDGLQKSRWTPEFYTYAQIDYFIQDVDIAPAKHGRESLYQCVLDFGIATLAVLCQDVRIEKVAVDRLTDAERRAIVLPPGA